MDDEEDELINSPLECTVTRDGVGVRICIYRGAREEGWLLEVEDAQGGSTVWEDRFASDQAALDEAMQTIELEGIQSFSVAPQ
jgi:hypothetical protein